MTPAETRPRVNAGKHERPPAVGARRRKPAELEREDEDEHEADPIDRHRGAHIGETHREGVDPGVLPDGREHAERQADGEGQRQPGDRKRDRRTEAVEDQIGDRRAEADRLAEVAR